MTMVAIWSGREVRALRTARRMNVREFAAHLGISDRMVSKWEAGGETIRPRPVNQSALDASLELGAAAVKHRFRTLIDPALRPAEVPRPSAGHDIGNLARHPLDGKVMLRIDAGPVRGRHRSFPVWVPAFYVDLELVTLEEYSRFGAAAGDPGWVGAGGEPALGVRWSDAQSYARWTGKAIISLDQWDRAAEFGAGLSRPQGQWCASPAGPLRRGSRRGPAGFRTATLSSDLHQLLAI